MPTLLDKLNRRWGHLGIPNITLLLIGAQVAAYLILVVRGDEIISDLALVPVQVLRGEIWRVVTFVAIPPITNLIFAFFAWYVFYLMGSALDANWGTFRYNVYLAIGWLATVAASFLVPHQPATNAFLAGSVFLAFAQLFPRFELALFFILPVQVRWLALLTWLTYGYYFITGTWRDRVLVVAAVVNFLIFFGKEIVIRMTQARRRMEHQRRQISRKDQPFHRCTVCGVTERTHPKMDFRYCSKCAGSHEYCEEHLRSHEHVVAPAGEQAKP